MICQKCKIDFLEKELDESHDVPCYLFKGNKRNIRKNQADKYGRRWLCKECHKKYEMGLAFYLLKILPVDIKNKLKEKAQNFSKRWFYEGSN